MLAIGDHVLNYNFKVQSRHHRWCKWLCFRDCRHK